MANTFMAGGQIYTLSDDGQMVTNAAGATMPIGMLPAGSEVAIAAQTAQKPITTPAPTVDPLTGVPVTGPSLLTQFGQGLQSLGKATGGGAMGDLGAIPIAGIPSPTTAQPIPVGQQPPAAIMKPAQSPLPQGEEAPQLPIVQQPTRVSLGGGGGLTGRPGPGGATMEELYAAERAEAQAREQQEIDKSINEAQKGQVYADYAQQVEADRARREALEAERRKVAEAENAKIVGLEKDVADARIKDPWANRGAVQTIMQTLGIALSQAGVALAHGGRNAALDIINAQMESDLAVQRMNLENKRGNLENARGALARTRQEYSDRATADEAARLLMLDKVKLDLNALDVSGMSAQTATNKDIISAQLDQQITTQKLNVLAAQQKAREKAAAKGHNKALEEYKLNAPVVDARVLNAKERERIAVIDGKGYLAPDDVTRRKLQESGQVFTGLEKNLGTLSGYIEETNPASRTKEWLLKTDKYGEVSATNMAVKMKLKTLWQLGVLSDAEYIRMDKAVPDATDIFKGSTPGRYRALNNDLMSAKKAQVNGLQRVENIPGLRPDVQYDIGAPVK